MSPSVVFFFFSSRRRHTRLQGDWSSDVCSSDLNMPFLATLTKHPVYKSDKQYRFIPEVARVSVPPSWPGPTTAVSQQVLDLYIIPDMFAQHVTGKLTADQAIAWAEKEMQEIYASRKRRP